MKEMVAGFLFDKTRERVVLIEKKKPDWQAGHYNAVGGKIEEGEAEQDAMVREFREETGLEIVNWIRFCFLHHEGDKWGVHFFKAVGPIDDVRMMEDEVPSIFHILSLPVNVVPHLRWLIPLALDTSGLDVDVSDPTG